MTKPLICFDVDGTIESIEANSEYVSGPVELKTLVKLQNHNVICVVSPSPYFPKGPMGLPLFPVFAEWGSDTYRHQNLLDALKWYNDIFQDDPPLKLYVSNNGDYIEAEKAGFIYVDADTFARSFYVNL